MNKLLILLFALAAAAQAVDWLDLKPLHRSKPVVWQEPEELNLGRIIGGEYATVGQFPYQVALRIDDAYFCGGSLISGDTVLTAAHCVRGFSKWDVHAGALNFTDTTEEGRVLVTTNDGQPHENYTAITVTHDLALLYLPQNVSGPNIGSVRLPSWSMKSELFVNETVRVSGWGLPSDASSEISEIMKFVDVEVITNEQCANWYGTLAVHDSNICTGTNNGTEATCSGDSGGPLVWFESDGIPTEIGIVSFGSSLGCETRFPSAFTRVTSYLQWIQDNSGAVDWKRSARPVYRTFPTLTARPYNHGRIIGGSVATPGQFPYQAALWLDTIYFCGGSLISTTVVLTAGHCGDGTNSFEAHLGAQNIYDETEAGRVIVTSTNGVVHQQYNPNNLHNDIALVILPSPVTLSASEYDQTFVYDNKFKCLKTN
ncbi:hypothetical protein B566_EDAN014732 [Ephemera danica]|nr:hypothetical protein B566_EDAN014732 [Ephemera danica]